MLKNVNFAIFKCQECNEVIKVGAGQVIDKVECECSKATKKQEKPKKEPKPKKDK